MNDDGSQDKGLHFDDNEDDMDECNQEDEGDTNDKIEDEEGHHLEEDVNEDNLDDEEDVNEDNLDDEEDVNEDNLDDEEDVNEDDWDDEEDVNEDDSDNEEDVNEDDSDDEEDVNEDDSDDEEDVNEEVDHEENDNVGEVREADIVDDDSEDSEDDDSEDDDSENNNEDNDWLNDWLPPASDDSEEAKISWKDLKRQFQLLEAECTSLVPEEEYEVELQQGVWKSTPEEILWSILERLPIASQCRFRCVCSRWKVLLSRSFAKQHGSQVDSRPLYTIMSGSKLWFFSHAEEKWYRTPHQLENCGRVDWKLQAEDGGLLCYLGTTYRDTWVLVHNPMTGAFQIVPPYQSSRRSGGLYVISFHVDKNSSSFKIVMPLMHFEETICYDSRTRLWTAFTGPGSYFTDIVLVRKNVIYARYIRFGHFKVCDVSSEQLKWTTVEVNLPCNAEKRYHIMGSKDHVMLVQILPKDIDAIRIWRLVDTEDASSLLLSKWAEMAVAVPDSMRPLLSDFQRCWLHGNNSICFVTQWTNRCLKYTFATKAWRVMPGNRRARLKSIHRSYLWMDWEPNLDLHVESFEFDFRSCPEIAGAYWQLISDAPSA